MIKAREAVLQVFPQAQVISNPISGRSGCLEVIVNGKKVHSKLNGQGVIDSKNLAQFQQNLRQSV